MLKNSYEKKSDNGRSETVNGDTAAKEVKGGRAADDLPRFVAPTHGGVDILKLLTELEDLVESAPKMMGAMLRFDEDRFHMTIMKIRANLPEEMKRASKLARDSERIVVETRENAERVVGDARKAAMTELERGKADASRSRDEAQNEAKRLRAEAQAELERQRQAAEREARHIQTEAAKTGEEIVAEAQAQAARLVSESEIVDRAQDVAQQIQSRAEEEAEAVRRGADDYARDVLANLEGVISRAGLQVQRGREMLER